MELLKGLVHTESILHAENAAAAALQGVEMGAAAECFAKIACECTDIGAFAAGYSYDSSWQTQRRVVGDVDAAGCSGVLQAG